MFGLFRNRKKGGPAVISVLKTISSEKSIVRMEVERHLIRFNTRLVMRDKYILVGKPMGLTTLLHKGDLVRFKVPWKSEYEVRMEIAAPQMGLISGQNAFLCHTPTGQCYPLRRGAERFSTRRFTNLYLEVPELGAQYRIIDLSGTGCKIATKQYSTTKSFELHASIGQSIIHLGEKMRIELTKLVPRAQEKGMAGMEFDVTDRGRHRHFLKLLLGTLAVSEIESATPRIA